MKKLLSLLMFIAVSNLLFAQTWQQVATDLAPLNGAPGKSGVMKVSGDGRPVVAYVSNNDRPTLAVYNPVNQAWDIYEKSIFSASDIGDISMDIVDDFAVVGYTQFGSMSYKIERVNINSGTWTQISSFTNFTLNYFNNNIKVGIGSSSPLEMSLAFENSSGDVECREYNGSTFVTVAGNAENISGSGTVVDEIRLYHDQDQIFILSNFNYGGISNRFRAFSKSYGSFSDFTLTGNEDIEINGANVFDFAGRRNQSNLEPTIHFTPDDVGAFNIVQNRKYNYAVNNYTGNLITYDAFYDVLDLASAGDNFYNYIFIHRDNQPEDSRVYERHGGAGTWSAVGGAVETGPCFDLEADINDNGKPFVAYRSGFEYKVKVFNTPPNFEDENIPQNICSANQLQEIQDFLTFIDDDGDSLFVTNINSSDPNIIDPQFVVVNTLSYSSVSAITEFEVLATPEPNASGSVTLDITVSDGFGSDTYSMTIDVFRPDFSLPDSTLCSNDAPINMSNFVQPIGGSFAGVGVLNNSFYPAQVTPGNTYPVTYSRAYPSLGCVANHTIIIDVDPAPNVSISTTPASCGDSNGEATATLNTPGSMFNQHDIYWSNGFSETNVNTSTNSSLSPGLYFANVTNEFGCTSTAPASVSSVGINITANIDHVTCFGASNGSIDVTISAPAGIASVQWSNGSNSQDINGLSAGPYEITVVDNDGCESTASFNVGSPDEITWTETVNPSSCGNNDGSASCPAQGGTPPYSYSWFDSQGNPLSSTTDTQSGLTWGNYFCTITDANGCSVTWSSVISEVGSPDVSLEEVSPASCDDDGAIDITVTSAAGIQSINWDNGATTEDLSDLSTGTYTVNVSDNNGCMGMLTVEVPPALPQLQPICLVTVDTITTTNRLIWEKPSNPDGIASFNIYRETSQANLFQLVGNQAYNEESLWTDSVASPMIRSWRYKIAAVDSCGVEGNLSDVHKTIHLSINLGLNNNINLAWDSYEGFNYSQFNIWRHTTATGWVELANLPSNTFSYTDPGINGIPGLDYMIEVVPPSVCESTRAQSHNSSRSNRTEGIFDPNGDITSSAKNWETLDFYIFPNPVNEVLNIEGSAIFKGAIYEIIDINGRVVLKGNLAEDGTIETASLVSGSYVVTISNDQHVNSRRFIKL